MPTPEELSLKAKALQTLEAESPGFNVLPGESRVGLGALVAQGATLGGADEMAGAAAVVADKALGLFGRGSGRPAGEVFESARQAQEQAISEVPAPVRVPAEIVGATLTGGPIARGIIGGSTGTAAVAKGALAGGLEGAVAGALSSEPGSRIEGAAVGTGAGTLLGAGVPLTVGGLSRFIERSQTLKKLGRAGRDAARRIMEALKNDDITIDQAAARLKRLGPEAVLADVGGENVRGLAQAVTGTAGRGRRQAERVLEARSRKASQRVAQAIREVTSGENADDVATRIIQERSAAARPLYDRALSVGEINDPAINRLIGGGNQKGSSILRAAIREAKNLDPDLADLPDNHIVLLDKAYKAIGGKANAARVAGDGQRSQALNDLRVRLRDRLVELNPAYGDALDTFSSQSNLLDALEMGRDALRPKGGVTAEMVNALPDGERTMFKVGIAESLVDLVERGVDSSAARRLIRTPKIRAQLKALFGDDKRGFLRFQSQLLRELQFARTAGIRQGSRTAPLQSEVNRLATSAVEAGDVALDLASGQSPIRTGLDLARRFATRPQQASPELNQALGSRLFTPGEGGNILNVLRQIELDRLARATQRSGLSAAGIGAAATVPIELRR